VDYRYESIKDKDLFDVIDETDNDTRREFGDRVGNLVFIPGLVFSIIWYIILFIVRGTKKLIIRKPNGKVNNKGESFKKNRFEKKRSNKKILAQKGKIEWSGSLDELRESRGGRIDEW
jgi:hypothetical protein